MCYQKFYSSYIKKERKKFVKELKDAFCSFLSQINKNIYTVKYIPTDSCLHRDAVPIM